MNPNSRAGFDFRSHRLPAAVLLFLCFWSFFYHNGIIELDLMEARNLVTAREMVTENHWLVPTMNGEIRIAKPPLPTWIAALVSLAAGGTDNMTLLRLPSAFAALLLVFCAYGFACSLTRDRVLALLAAIVLASNFVVIEMAHRATWDIFCHAFMLAAIWALVAGLQSKRGALLLTVAGLLMGISFLSKGPVAFFSLLLPFSVSYLWIFGARQVVEKWRLLVLALALCVFISVLWPAYIYYFHPEALIEIAQKESDAWMNRHVKPFLYYLSFPFFSGYWLLISILALIKPVAEKYVGSVANYRFLLLWLVLDLALLSVIPEKKTRYLLPAMIPLSLLAGSLLRGLMEKYATARADRRDSMLLLLHAGLISAFSIILPGYIFYRLHQLDSTPAPAYIAVVAAAFLLAIVLSWGLLKRKSIFGLVLLTALQSSLAFVLYLDFYREVGIKNPEYRVMTKQDASLLPAGTEIFLMANHDGTKYVWDLDRKVRRWQAAEAERILEQRKPIAVISVGSPDQRLAASIDGDLSIETLGRYDYSEHNAEKQKIIFSLVRPID